MNRPGPIAGKKMLQRVLWRVWEAGQASSLDREIHELTSIVLQLIGQRIEHLSGITCGDLGEVTASRMLDLASIAAHGCPFKEWGRRNELQKSAMAWEFSRLVPDYDPEMDKANSVGRSARGKGTLYQMPSEAGQVQQKPVRQMPRRAEGTG